MIKEKYPILISNPRNGSTWVQSYIRAFYNLKGVCLPKHGILAKDSLKYSAKNPLTTEEYFGGQYSQAIRNIKISVIENLEKQNLVLCHKVHTLYFLEDQYLWNWFKEFYKDYHIIILRRRNIWKTYISYLFHQTMDNFIINKGTISVDLNLHPWHGNSYSSTHEDIIKSTIQTNNIKFTYNYLIWKRFIKGVRFLQDDVIRHFSTKPKFWLEDLTNEKLAKIFQVEVQDEIRPLKRLNYMSYYDIKELKIIKDNFEERFENEFRFYGYEYKY